MLQKKNKKIYTTKHKKKKTIVLDINHGIDLFNYVIFLLNYVCLIVNLINIFTIY